MGWVGGLGLELSKSVPDCGLVVEAGWIDDFRVDWDATGVDLLGGSEESLLETSVDDTPESHGLVPRGGQEDLVVGAEGDVCHVVVVASQGVLGNGDSAEVLSGVVVDVPDENLLVSSSGDEEGVGLVLDGKASRGDAGDVGLVTFDELFG